MGSTIIKKPLYATLSLKLGDKTFESFVKIPNIDEPDNRIINIPTTETEIMKFGSTTAAGQYIKNNVRMIAVVNRDDSNWLRLQLKKIITAAINLFDTITPGDLYTNGIYANVPLLGGTGTGATANISIAGTKILTLNNLVGGTGYTPSTYTSVPLTSGSGTGALATVVVTANGGLTSVSVVTGGSLYSPGTYLNVPIQALSPGLTIRGTGALATIVVNGSFVITSITVTTPGAGYVTGDQIFFDVAYIGGTGSNYSGLATASTTGQITSVAITGRGINYAVNNVLTCSNASVGGSGSGFSIRVASLCGGVSAVDVNQPGTGYVPGDSVSAASVILGLNGFGFSILVGSIKNISNISNHKLDPGRFFVLGNTKISTENTGVSFNTFNDIESISAQADTNPIDVEIYVAAE